MALAITHISQNVGRARPCDEATTRNVVLYPSYVNVASISRAPARGQSSLSREVWNISMVTNRANQCHPNGQLICCLLPQGAFNTRSYITFLPDLSPYVMKTHGEPQLKGEYTGMLELYNAAPHMVPKPCLFFYVCDYIPTTKPMSDTAKLAKLVADLHKKWESPTGIFVFYLPTFDWWLPQEVGHQDDS
ncbi:hypothetical protein GX50_02992 [[Emmonsia] crescens]|uniref:Protein-ribulosamine 3-kinase n=1 Tax=[Emmonsia] crescens TaxID=73230 RepID=A0A2B7ZM15_9EURO|nr:hypothetical protein GX50_02992 [Emmonsia crescens]